MENQAYHNVGQEKKSIDHQMYQKRVFLLLIMLIMLYPTALWMIISVYWISHLNYTAIQIYVKYIAAYRIFAKYNIAVVFSEISLFVAMLCSIILLGKLSGTKSYFIALALLILSSLLFLFTLWYLM